VTRREHIAVGMTNAWSSQGGATTTSPMIGAEYVAHVE
jgi:hypothetical protein